MGNVIGGKGEDKVESRGAEGDVGKKMWKKKVGCKYRRTRELYHNGWRRHYGCSEKKGKNKQRRECFLKYFMPLPPSKLRLLTGWRHPKHLYAHIHRPLPVWRLIEGSIVCSPIFTSNSVILPLLLAVSTKSRETRSIYPVSYGR